MQEKQVKVIQATGNPFFIKDSWARIIGIPVISLIMHLVFHQIQNQELSHFKGYFISFLYTFTYWEGLRLIWMKLQSKFPHYSQTRKRLMILVFMVLGFGVFATVLVKYFGYFLVGTDCTLDKMISGYFIGLIPTTLVMVVYEAVYFFHSWKEKVIEAETLARTQLVSQLEALKSQLDPHFLFNSLNTLSSLIDENEAAQQYLNRLADVYRYVLASKNRDTVTLREEMEFVDAFLYLAQVRFRTGLEVRKTIPEASWDKKVAPLGVQLLVENALKHNAITQHEPLAIDIEIEGDYLWVKNEIRPKVHLESSTKLGLKNILERYKLLTTKPVHIFNNRVRFEVALPLIA